MPEPDLIQLFVGPLESARIDGYMISGSVASIEFGEPRATLDIDIALQVSASDVRRFGSLFPAPDFYTPPPEVLELEVSRPNRGHFNIIHTLSGLRADFYPSPEHPYLRWAMAHRRRTEISGLLVWLAPVEYVILWKLAFLREGGGDKHGRDIRGMLSVSGGEIDRSLLDTAAAGLGLGALLREVEWGSPPIHPCGDRGCSPEP